MSRSQLQAQPIMWVGKKSYSLRSILSDTVDLVTHINAQF